MSARIFLSVASGAGNFLELCMHFVYSHLCCMIFFTVKALQEIFLQIFHSPSKIKWSTPYDQFFDKTQGMLDCLV